MGKKRLLLVKRLLYLMSILTLVILPLPQIGNCSSLFKKIKSAVKSKTKKVENGFKKTYGKIKTDVKKNPLLYSTLSGAAAGGVALGAAGTVVPGVGTIIGGVAGAIAGGVDGAIVYAATE